MQSVALRQFLASVHRRHPGLTGKAIYALAPDHSSYRREALALLEVVPDARRMLDVGCGDGHLLVELARVFPQAALCGLDLVEEEVEAARTRVPLADVRVGTIDALPFADASFDAVVSHLVLMLLGPLDVELAEHARVLRSGGVLLACIDAPPNPSDAVRTLIASAVTASGRQNSTVFSAGADARLYDEGQLRELLGAHGFDLLSIERFALQQQSPDAEVAWDVVAGMYSMVDASDAERDAARRSVLAAFGGLNRPFSLPMQLIVARKRAA